MQHRYVNEWKHKGSVLGPGKDGPQTAVESLIVSKWNVTARNTNPPTPNLHMVDENRGMEMNLTPEGCFYRYPNLTESPQNNWTQRGSGRVRERVAILRKGVGVQGRR